MNEIEIIADRLGWEEGRYVDQWTIPHFLCGAGIGIAASALKIHYPTDLIIAISLIIGWEIREYLIPPKEYPENRIVDAIVGFAGFGLVRMFIP